MRIINLIFLVFFVNYGIVLGQIKDAQTMPEPVYERIPARSFYKTPVTFLFSPSFKEDSNLISSWVDSLYMQSDIAENRLDSDLIKFTLRRIKLNRNSTISYQGYIYNVELDSQLIANDVVAHFLNRQDDFSFNFDKVLEITKLDEHKLSRNELEQVSSLALSRHLFIIFDLDDSDNRRKKLIAHVYGLQFDEKTSKYFFEKNWISPEDSDSIKDSRHKSFELTHYQLNWRKSFSSIFDGPVTMITLQEILGTICNDFHGIPHRGLLCEIEPFMSVMENHSNVHTGQKFKVYRTDVTNRKNQYDTISRIILDPIGDLYVRKSKESGNRQSVSFYQKGCRLVDSSLLLERKRSAGIGVFLGYEAGFQKVNQDQLSLHPKNGGAFVLGMQLDLSKYLSKGLKINVPHSIHLFGRFNRSVLFNTHYKEQVIDHLATFEQNEFPIELTALDAIRMREIMEIKKNRVSFGLSKDFYITPTWYITPYLGLGFSKIAPVEWPKFPPSSSNFPYHPRKIYEYYELYIGNPVEFNADGPIVYYHNLKDDLAIQQDYFFGLQLSAVLGFNVHASGYIEAIKNNTQWLTDVEYYMPDMFIFEEYGARIGVSIKYEF